MLARKKKCPFWRSVPQRVLLLWLSCREKLKIKAVCSRNTELYCNNLKCGFQCCATSYIYKSLLPMNHSLCCHCSCNNDYLLSYFILSLLTTPSSLHTKSISLPYHIYITSNGVFITNSSQAAYKD